MARPPITMVSAARAAILSSATPMAIGSDWAAPWAKIAGIRTSTSYGEEVLDDQPADGDVPDWGVELAVVGQHPHQYHRARDREGEAEDQAGREPPAGGVRDERSDRRRHEALDDRAWDGDAAHGEEVFDVELHPDAEHQQDDPDLGELLREVAVGGEARRERADDDAGDEVADNRRHLQALGDVAADEGGDQAPRQRQDQLQRVHGGHRYSRLPRRSRRRHNGPDSTGLARESVHEISERPTYSEEFGRARDGRKEAAREAAWYWCVGRGRPARESGPGCWRVR